MMKGYLNAQGINISEHRIASSLARVAPESYERRRHNVVDKTNPVPYTAHCFGHKIHFDQNEKLVMYGVTHVIAVDGYSAKIVGYTTLPIKNNLSIYGNVYRYFFTSTND